MVDTYNIMDSFRDKYPTLKRYTWRKKIPLKQARLDYFLISANIMQYVKNAQKIWYIDQNIVWSLLNFNLMALIMEICIGNIIILYPMTKNTLVSSISIEK